METLLGITWHCWPSMGEDRERKEQRAPHSPGSPSPRTEGARPTCAAGAREGAQRQRPAGARGTKPKAPRSRRTNGRTTNADKCPGHVGPGG
eukprot:5105010-Pyramimonas_sp.AAC.1